jgi:hypothetical protein
MPWLTAAKWIGTAAGVSGAIMIALNVGLVIYGFGLSVIDGDTIENMASAFGLFGIDAPESSQL